MLVKETFKQGLGYGLVGGAQLALDFLIFMALTIAGIPVAGANVIARIIIAGLGFWLNGKWTFGRSGPSSLGVVHFGKYLTLLVGTTFFSTIGVMMAARGGGVHVAWLVKPFVDIFLAGVGFLVSKYWVYR